jgi:hypothetical protein
MLCFLIKGVAQTSEQLMVKEGNPCFTLNRKLFLLLLRLKALLLIELHFLFNFFQSDSLLVILILPCLSRLLLDCYIVPRQLQLRFKLPHQLIFLINFC